jgi:hypothetical protein
VLYSAQVRVDEAKLKAKQGAREKAWCDDSLSDNIAAENYREETCSSRRKTG